MRVAVHHVIRWNVANFSPYRTEHINRFGSYDMHFDREPQPITEALRLSPALVMSMH